MRLDAIFGLGGGNFGKVTEVFSQGCNYHTYSANGDCIKGQKYMLKSDFYEQESAELKKVLSHTRKIICEGAAEGFNPMVCDWADKLFLNNANIARVLDK